MKQKAAAVATSFALLASIAATPAAAQTNDLNNPINDSAVNNTVPGTTTNEDRTGGFEWWWLLPLLAIPLYFVLRSEDRSDEPREYRDQRLAGTRGGESRRERNEREREDEYRDEEVL